MSLDISRSTFNPRKDFTSVVMQQGRVQLDSDWNEFQAEFARRAQAGTLDSLGRVGYSHVTPNAFKIFATEIEHDNWRITIGVGRMYVDGILVGNHGEGGNIWDTELDESVGGDIAFDSQPYYPRSSFPNGSQFLVYLDIWQREVSYVECPELIEPAVGVDTTGRLQTVWQVKVLKLATDIECSTPCSEIPDWPKLIRPSAGLLTNGLVKSTTATSVCCLSPTLGYTGLENQFYRVEIHSDEKRNPDGAILQAATFKWSRNNASIAAKVIDFPTVAGNGLPVTQLTVDSTGRDDVLGFRDNDWIEITNDYLELNGLPGELHLIGNQGVNASANTITLVDAIRSPADFSINGDLNKIDASLHPRIRRWDQGWDQRTFTGKVFTDDGQVYVDLTTNGTAGIPVPSNGAKIVLENGLTVSFKLDPANRNFKKGDYWSFAARAIDGSFQQLTDARPQGINHHYARLAVKKSDGEWNDCRTPFEPLRLSYVGGDGQEAEPDGTLQQPLQVAVYQGNKLLPDAQVQFTITKGSGVLNPSGGKATTDSSGVATCVWKLATEPDTGGPYPPHVQKVEASLENISYSCTPIRFNASLPFERFCYVGGDGQEAGADFSLPKPLQVAVFRGYQAVPKSVVQFMIQGNLNGTLKGTDPTGHPTSGKVIHVATGADGVAEANWTLDPGQPGKAQTVEARLLDATGNPLLQPIRFNSQIESSGGFEITKIMLAGTDKDLVNDRPLLFSQLEKGIFFLLNQQLNNPPTIVPTTCYLTLEIPISLFGSAFADWKNSATVPIVLAGRVTVNDNRIAWAPTEPGYAMLRSWMTNGLVDHLLARFTILGNFIWNKTEAADLYLDGDSFGTDADGQPSKIRLPSGDGRPGGDFRMWFWLQRPTLTMDPPALSFGNVAVGAAGIEMQSVIKSEVAQPLTAAIIQNANGPFILNSPSQVTALAGAISPFKVKFAPTSAGEFTGKLRVTGASDFDFVEINLTGTGIHG